MSVLFRLPDSVDRDADRSIVRLSKSTQNVTVAGDADSGRVPDCRAYLPSPAMDDEDAYADGRLECHVV